MYPKRTPAWKALLILFGSVLLFLGALVFAADEVCRTNIASRLPLYPGAEIVGDEYNFLRSRAMGITRMTLRTADDEETVRQWFRDLTLELLERGEFRGMAVINWQIAPSDEGTLIHIYTECGQF